MTNSTGLAGLLSDIRKCEICAENLALGPRPVLEASTNSRILIIGQAPGTKVHATGIPWNDPSGNRLREWLNVDRDVFYNPEFFGIVPMGFCYPGKGKSGDLPPRHECATTWHEPLLSLMPNVELTLLIGQYAQAYYLKERMQKTLTETVAQFETYLPKFLALPHPSPRNQFWFKRNPWFQEKVLPILRERTRALIR